MASKLQRQKCVGNKIHTDCIYSIRFIQKEVRNMTAKAKVKVIKKSSLKVVEIPAAEDKLTKQQAAREMVSNVSNWVNEFQQRKRYETKQAIEKFLINKTQPNGV